MSAKILKIDPQRPEEKLLAIAADILRQGGLVIIPTETVYGIAANNNNEKTIKKLSAIKKRSQDKPFSLLIAGKEKIKEFTMAVPVSAYKLIDRFWPGPLTLVLRGKDGKTLGLRMPDDKIALRVIELSDVPVVCPSANISGNPAPATFDAAIKDLRLEVDLAIDAGKTKLGIESTVVDLAVEPWKILREGAIEKEKILECVSKKIVLFVCTGNSCRSVMAKGLLEKKLRDSGRSDVEVSSAGLMTAEGLGASLETRELLKKEGIDVSVHRSRRVTAQMLDKSDLILVMEKLQEGRILQLAPQVKNRLFLLKEFAKTGDNNLDIADPIGKSGDFYEYTFGIIKEATEKVSEII